jgi:hypothetical protein
MGKKVPAIERFMLRVQKNDGGCWHWTAFKKPEGYGIFCLAKGKNVSAHRFSYTHHVGEIPSGMEIDHTCSNRACVNPDHLESVTHLENVRRGVERGGYANNGKELALAKRSKTHCPSGHPYAGENLIIDGGSGGRRCRICNNAKTRRYQARKALAQ